MAEYIRFEIYVPTYYTTMETDSHTGKVSEVTHRVDPITIADFVEATLTEFHGITQANPVAAAPFKGWWQARAGGPVAVDFLTHLFGLVRFSDEARALTHFTSWKAKLEAAAHQEVILVVYYPVHTIGNFLN